MSEVDRLMITVGAAAEIAHGFYAAMIKSGASQREATAGMQSFIAQFWHESMEDARRKRRKEQEE